MKLTYGSYPVIEIEFVKHISKLQQSPLNKTLVITPSAGLGRYLQAALTRELKGTVNIYFHKLSALNSILDKEIPGEKLPLLSSSLLQDFVLKNILERGGRVKRSLVSSMKSTLRDMADARIEPDLVREKVQEGLFFSEEDKRYILNLLDVYDAYYSELSLIKGSRTYKDLFSSVIEHAAKSKYLQSFNEIIFYGFYEFTGTQLELFKKIKERFPLSVFFPYAQNAAYAYSKKFFDANILGGAKEINSQEDTAFSALFNPAGTPEKQDIAITLSSASGPKDELYFASKKILELVKSGKYNFADIAVVSRTMDEYNRFIPSVFEDNHIPLNTVISNSLLSSPLAVFCHTLLNLSLNNFYKDDVLGIITSPYFKIKNSWRAMAEHSCVERDYEQWADLITPRTKFYDPAFMEWMGEIKGLSSKLLFKDKWKDHCQNALDILDKFTNTAVFNTEEEYLFTRIKEIVKNLEGFAIVREDAGEDEFLEEFSYALKMQSAEKVYASQLGVSVIDVMGLRAQRFKVVFLLGLNDGLFPQIIREDPLLKDRMRIVLRDTLGFWIGQKLDRHSEEKMLFYFTLCAAKETLFCSYHTSAGGKESAPSMYMLELARAAALDLEKDIFTLGHRELDKYFLTDETLLTQKEMSIKAAVCNHPAEDYARAQIPFDAAENFAMCAQIKTYGALNAFDGVCAEGQFDAQNKYGFSPTSLQTLAACPMKYFFQRILSIKEPDMPLKRSTLNPDDTGLLYHKFFEKYYKDARNFDELFAEVFAEDNYKEYGIYPVVWNVIRTSAKNILKEFLSKDEAAMEGFRPSLFEIKTECEHEGVHLRGTIDRIDLRGPEYRIIDYKKKQKGNKTLTEKDIFKTNLLQPVIYLIMSFALKETNKLQADSFNFVNIESGTFMQTLKASYAEEINDKFSAYLHTLLSFIKEGKFFLSEGEHCAFCAFSFVCRKEHAGTKFRAKNSAQNKALEGFR